MSWILPGPLPRSAPAVSAGERAAAEWPGGGGRRGPARASLSLFIFFPSASLFLLFILIFFSFRGGLSRTVWSVFVLHLRLSSRSPALPIAKPAAPGTATRRAPAAGPRLDQCNPFPASHACPPARAPQAALSYAERASRSACTLERVNGLEGSPGWHLPPREGEGWVPKAVATGSASRRARGRWFARAVRRSRVRLARQPGQPPGLAVPRPPLQGPVRSAGTPAAGCPCLASLFLTFVGIPLAPLACRLFIWLRVILSLLWSRCVPFPCIYFLSPFL